MSTCIWQGRENPRTLRNRHEDDCESETCKGCQPCAESHCVVCGIEHVADQTCPTCIATVRFGLAEIESLYRQLPAQALYGGSDGYLEASRPIPGGEAMVLLSPSSNGRAVAWSRERGDDVSHLSDERIGEVEPPEQMLVTWEDDWREIRNHRTEEIATLTAAAAYLDEHLAWAAQHHDAFDDFANDIRRQVGRLEDVLHAGERKGKTVPCIWCKGTIDQIYHKRTGFSGEYQCMGRCGRKYTTDQYRNAVKAAHLIYASKLTASQLEQKLGVKASRVRVWGARYPEIKAGKNEDGLWLYKVSEVESRLDNEEGTEVAEPA